MLIDCSYDVVKVILQLCQIHVELYQGLVKILIIILYHMSVDCLGQGHFIYGGYGMVNVEAENICSILVHVSLVYARTPCSIITATGTIQHYSVGKRLIGPLIGKGLVRRSLVTSRLFVRFTLNLR